MTYLPYVIVIVIIAALMMLMQRNRRRQVAAELVRASQIGPGTEVMTTSGLYGTVVAKDDDGTVLLAIAPGVEVKWALAALRDAASLSERYRGGMSANPEDADEPADQLSDSARQISLDKDEPGGAGRAS